MRTLWPTFLIAWATLACGRGHVRVRPGPRVRVRMSSPAGGSPCVIRVLGVGGGGSNAVTRMTRQDPGVECFTINTDAQALEGSVTRARPVQIGRDVTRGLGAGGNPAIGRLAAEESRAEINAIVSGSDLVFVVAGMGGGTGSGAAPIVAECAKAAGCLTIGVVTRPFAFEGARRMRQAVEAIAAMRDSTDALLVVSNDKLLASAQAGLPINQAFEFADEILRQGVTGRRPPPPRACARPLARWRGAAPSGSQHRLPCRGDCAHVCAHASRHEQRDPQARPDQRRFRGCTRARARDALDMRACSSTDRPASSRASRAQVCAIMANGGLALMGVGSASGSERALEAARAAINSPLLDFPVSNARGVLFTMSGPANMSLAEVNAVARVITQNADPDANVIFGATIDESAVDTISITVVATGLVV